MYGEPADPKRRPQRDRGYAAPTQLMPALGVSLVLSSLAGGCNPPAPPTGCDQVRTQEANQVALFDQFVEDENVTDEQIAALTLQEVPVELQTVLDDVGTFTIDLSHPLRNVEPGTVVDSEESGVDWLNGCWGRIETERQFDDAETDMVVAGAWRVDLREGAQTVDAYIYSGVDGVPCRVDPRPFIQAIHYSVVSTDDGQLVLHKESVQAAGVDDDGTLSLHRAAAAAAASADDVDLTVAFSVDGNYLVTAEPDYDPENPSPADLDLWIRFDCVR